MEPFRSPEPEVRLVKYFPAAYKNVIATARTCYSSKGIVADESIDENWDWLAKSLYQAGHHTTLQHAHFQFTLDRVSRHFVWSFLHSHPFYNSEQVSQRYVAVKPNMAAIPPLDGKALQIFEKTLVFQMERYQQLCEMLFKPAEREYKQRFPARSTEDKKYRNDIRKKAQEIARYVLPVCTFTYLYHTVSGVTLLRYYRLCQQYDTPVEQRLVVQKMVEEVLRVEPKYREVLEESLPLEAMPENTVFEAMHSASNGHTREFLAEFDQDLGGRISQLTAYKDTNESILADSVREVLGLTRHALSNEAAIDLVLNPQKNSLLGESLNVTTHSKLARCMVHPSYTFRKKISHTADSQDQRHRMVPASRPILAGHLTAEPDYITPGLIELDGQARAVYVDTMTRSWEAMRELRALGVREEFVQYLLPNAVSVRMTESGDLLNLRHKYAMRLCYNAQEEIWRASVDEVRQIMKVNPLIGKYLLPPCTLRKLAGSRPICPEGARFCGERVWNYDIEQFERII